jgi:hypothetical protein
VPDPWNDSELVQKFRMHVTTALPRAPLNAALCRVIAQHRDLSGLLSHAPLINQHPVLLLAALHFLVLDEPDSELAAWYPNITVQPREPDDNALADALREFANERGAALLEIIATRSVQTNEVARCALFLPAFALLAHSVGPLAHLDIGTSAGLTTLARHFSYRYDDQPPIGNPSNVEIVCSTRGVGPVPTSVPPIAVAIGIDTNPINLAEPLDARWLQACCWPDQGDRFDRLRAAIELAQNHPPDVRIADAVEGAAEAITELDAIGHPVVTTSWVMNYLSPQRRVAFVAELDRIGTNCDLSWVIVEAPAQSQGLPHAVQFSREDATALTVVTWRSGQRTTAHLGTCHPHGYWIHWAESASVAL